MTNKSENTFTLDRVSVRYVNGRQVFKKLNLDIDLDRRVGVVGETGSGKSSLLRALAGLERLSYGNIHFNGNRVAGPDEKLIPGHPSIAYLSQDHQLPNNVSVETALLRVDQSGGSMLKKVARSCDIGRLLKRKTKELSGGERQRVALAGVLLTGAKILLLDEPFSNLDPMHKESIRELLEKIRKDFNLGIILVAHDPMDVLSWADEIIVLRKGVVVQRGNASEVYKKPVDTYTAGLFGYFSLLDSKKWKPENKKSKHRIEDHYFVRPEDVQVSDMTNDSSLEITAIRFLGHINLVFARNESSEVVFYSSNTELKTGERVSLSF